MTNLVDEYGYPDKLREQAPEQRQRWGPVTDHEPQRNTDYDFPQGWGRLSDEQKSKWFVRQRTYRQAWRQWDAGAMMQGFTKEEIAGGLSPLEAVNELTGNPFRYDG